MNTRLHTVFGSIFTLIVISPTEIATILLTGALGAVGAYVGSLLVKWVHTKIISLFRRIKGKWSK